MTRDTIAILDFGSQYTQLIARRFRELQVYSEILPPGTPARALRERGVLGIVLSGGPDSVYARGAPRCDRRIFDLGLPVLGICYGMHLMGHLLGGDVKGGDAREFGPADLSVKSGARLLDGLAAKTPVWMSHGDSLQRPPDGFAVVASTANTPVAAIEDARRRFFGIQFHPEVNHTREGMTVLANFLEVSGCRRDWNATSFTQDAVARIRETVGPEGRVLCALSGGVDSAVAALLVHQAIGDRLTCVFVDNGVLRKDEAAQVRKRFADRLRLRVVFVDASRRFLAKLRGVADPERKRKVIGREFIAVFEQASKRLKGFGFLAQGTLYPDVIESTSSGGPSVMIKSHHNVGGLPKRLRFKLVEPLRELFKDEVRAVGLKLGLDEEFVYRQPFPGPGLAVRCLGAVTAERLAILREVDDIIVREVKEAGLYRRLWQTFGVLLPVRSVGVMGDYRTYQYAVVIRAVESADGMTADWARLPHDLLARISTRIVNDVRGVNRVTYDISSKPPSTIEWE